MTLYAIPKANLPSFLADHGLFWEAVGKVDPSADVYPIIVRGRNWKWVQCDLVLNFDGAVVSFQISPTALEKWAWLSTILNSAL